MNPLSAVFRQVLSMSLTASLVIAVLCVLRLCLKKAPKKFSYWLWAAAAFRLICPFSFSSVFSLFSHSSMETVQSAGPLTSASYLPSASSAVTDFLSGALSAAPGAPVPEAAPGSPAFGISGDALLQALALLWVLGICALLAVGITSYVRTRRLVSTAVKLYGRVFECGAIRSPFVLGFFRPRIYLPFGLEAVQKDAVLCHESVHIRRGDHLVKPLAFLILAMHWFNPLVWLAFHLMAKDMEMSCDERVLELAGDDVRRSYSLSLLSFAENRRFPSPNPLAFGETGVKDRVKNVMTFRKAKVWVSVAAAAACLLVAAACSANPAQGSGPASTGTPNPTAPPAPKAPSAPPAPSLSSGSELNELDELDRRTKEVLELLFTGPDGELTSILSTPSVSPSPGATPEPSAQFGIIGGADGPTQIYATDPLRAEKLDAYFRDRYPEEYFFEYGYGEFLKHLASQWGFYLFLDDGGRLELSEARREADGESGERRWTADVKAVLPDGTFRIFSIPAAVTGSEGKIESFQLDESYGSLQVFFLEDAFRESLSGGIQDETDEHTMALLETLFTVPAPALTQKLRDLGYPAGAEVLDAPPVPEPSPSPTAPPPSGSLTPLEEEEERLVSGAEAEASQQPAPALRDAFDSYYSGQFPADYFTEEGLKNAPVFAQDWTLYDTCLRTGVQIELYAAGREDDPTTTVRRWNVKVRLTAPDNSTMDTLIPVTVQEQDGKISSFRLGEEAAELRETLKQFQQTD